MRVAYQAGVIRALHEAGLEFQHADGTSGGTINLAMLLSGVAPSEMCDRWRTLQVHKFVSFLPLKKYLKSKDRMALGDADGIRRHVFPHLGVDVGRIRSNEGTEGTFNLCNFTTKTLEVVPHGRIDEDLLVAGITLPIFMPPVPKDGSLYVDAVWIKDANLVEAVRRGADELWLVWCIGDSPEYRAGVFNQYVHMIEMSAHGALFDEFRQIAEMNQRIRRGEPVDGRTRPVALHVIRPEVPLPLDPDLYLGNIDTATLIDMGYADAWRYLEGRTADGVALDPTATKMRPGRPGVTFRETMAGAFAMGATDPAAGAAAGAASGPRMQLHATVVVRDIDRFVRDPSHEGEITGHVTAPALGENVPAKRGRFRLFSPTKDPRLRKMVYEFALRSGQREYYLEGWKEVRADGGFDVWKDTTRLLVRLHDGPDAGGPVVGAGILTLTIREMRRLVASMRPVHVATPAEGAQAVAKFGNFFLGNLWDAYARPSWWRRLWWRTNR